jgi:ribosome-binding protein aMBF1 (putative translation factor)
MELMPAATVGPCGYVDVKGASAESVAVKAVAVKAVAVKAVDVKGTMGDASARMATYLEEKSLRTRFAENLRVQRTKKGISQEGLAELAGFHRTFVSKVERGATSTSIDTIEKIARALNVDPVELFRP